MEVVSGPVFRISIENIAGDQGRLTDAVQDLISRGLGGETGQAEP